MIALGLIYDVASSRLRELPMPDVPRPPLFDGRLTREKGRFCWMSEMTLRDLEWWEGRKRESAEQGGQWADKDRKMAETLAKWTSWRRLFPTESWNGKRGDERVTAAAPGRDPKLHDWGQRTPRGSTNERKDTGPAPDESGGEDGGYGGF